MLSDRERLNRLRLIRSERVGPVTYRRLIERFGSAEAALAAVPVLARRGGAQHIALCPLADAEREMARLTAMGGRLIFLEEPDYPPPLAAIDDAPPVISVLGQSDVLARPAVAIVGSRNASLNGRRLATGLARDLGAAGFVVVSGLARGIDAAAHAGALATGTIAVVAGGVDIIYPPENAALHADLLARGAVVSEVANGVAPQARHFPRRNRVIAGMARGVVVVEASMNSGSLITARCAVDQGREVFAVPGSPLDPRARGTNDLIRQGATLAESAEDVLHTLGPAMADRRPVRRRDQQPGRLFAAGASPASTSERPEPASAPASSEMEAAHRAIGETLSPAPVAVDEIIRACQLSPAVVTMVLLEWELAGRLERHPGNLVSLIAAPTGK